ncbi:uncharacterized protein DS421_11g336040 [Arachis hypogaea]|nr:uncharacterized protein DS421_11g336040 [Arachis hypogaea]
MQPTPPFHHFQRDKTQTQNLRKKKHRERRERLSTARKKKKRRGRRESPARRDATAADPSSFLSLCAVDFKSLIRQAHPLAVVVELVTGAIVAPVATAVEDGAVTEARVTVVLASSRERSTM